MTTAALRGVVASIRRYGRVGVLRPGATAPGVAGTWRVGRPAVTLNGQVFLQAEDAGLALLGGTLTGEALRVGDSRTWHRVGSAGARGWPVVRGGCGPDGLAGRIC